MTVNNWTSILMRNSATIDVQMACENVIAILRNASADGKSLSLMHLTTDGGDPILISVPDVVAISPLSEEKRKHYEERFASRNAARP